MLVTAKDVQDRLLNRTLTVEELETVETWIGDLLSDVRQRIPNLDELAADMDYLALLKRVIFGAVKRVLDNPRGLRQMSVSIDDYTRAETVDSSASAGALYLSDAELELLIPALAGDAFSIRVAGEPDYPRRWYSTDGWV